jgi:DNA-binding transcriptional ArsR family regulator
VLTLLGEGGGGTATTLAAQLPVSRVAVIKHLGVLSDVGLVERRRAGREVRFSARPAQLSAAARNLDAIAAEWDSRLAKLKALAEAGD